MSVKNIKKRFLSLYGKFKDSEKCEEYFEECKEYFKELIDDNNKYNNIFYKEKFIEEIKKSLDVPLEINSFNSSFSEKICREVNKFLKKRIYRIEPFNRVKKLLQYEELVLVRPRKWEDPYENFFLKDAITKDGKPVNLDKLEKDLYGQCWTLEEESDALWRIYSPNKDGVRITTTIGRLFDAIYNIDEFPDAHLQFFIGQVKYKRLEDIQEIMKEKTLLDIQKKLGKGDIIRGSAILLMIKRDIFSYEKEIRILASKLDEKDINKNIDECNGLWKFEVNIKKLLLKNLYLDPRLDENKFNECRKVLEEIKNKKNLRLEIEQSKLYKFKGGPTITD